jgi:hypothetical protein
MQTNNPLDQKLHAQRNHIPPGVRDSVVFLADTLDLTWAASQAVFGDKAVPEHAFRILEIMLEMGSEAEEEGEYHVN